MTHNPYPNSAICECCKHAKAYDWNDPGEGFYCELNIKLREVTDPDNSDCKMYGDE